jgi:murein DD-endopeptidase MepM/ murein hydrolase activator NlpD
MYEQEFEAFNEQPFSFETEEEAEMARRRRMPARRFIPRRGPNVRRQTFFRGPLTSQRFGPQFPKRIPFRPPVRPPVSPGLFTPAYPVPPAPFPVDPSGPPPPPPRDTRPFGSSGSGSAPTPAPPPMDDEPVSATFDSDTPQNPPDSTAAPDGVEGAPAAVEGPTTDSSSEPSAPAADPSEFYMEFESNAPSASSFVPTPVENPGGGRIKDKRPPDRTEVVTVRGVGQRRIPLHRLAANALRALIKAARADGLAKPLLRPVSGFRDPARQTQLWQQALARYRSPQEARKWIAPPGGSAHQSGRAIDFHLGGRNASNNVAQLRTLPAYRWLVANARRFGFYPYEREPWHWEYNPPVAAGRELEWNEAENYEWTTELGASPSPACVETGKRAKALLERGRELNRRTFARRGQGLNNRIHAAMDVPGPRGAPVYAPLDGQVIFSGRKSGYGNIVILLHRQPPPTNAAGPGAVTTAFAHLDQRLVNVGACVTAGQAIGRLGNSAEDDRGNRGSVRPGMGLHLHFSVHRVQGDRNRPRYRDRSGIAQSQVFPDRPPDQLGRLFGSRYEEDWTRQVRPDRWLAELGIRIAATTTSTQQARSVHAPAQAQRSAPEFDSQLA